MSEIKKKYALKYLKMHYSNNREITRITNTTSYKISFNKTPLVFTDLCGNFIACNSFACTLADSFGLEYSDSTELIISHVKSTLPQKK